MSHNPPSVDPAEIEKFAKFANQWWDPRGSFAPLHKFNPIRLRFIGDIAADRFGRDLHATRPFEGLTLIDLGCGGGLLAEPMARLGFSVTGLDAAEQNVRAARLHATRSGLSIAYHVGTAEEIAAQGQAFDVVLNMEVVEHVADFDGFVAASAALLRPGGLMLVATINKTLKSLAFAKLAAEYVLRWVPAGTHDWTRFVAPATLCASLRNAGLEIIKVQGVTFDLLTWSWTLSADTDVNYIVAASRQT